MLGILSFIGLPKSSHGRRFGLAMLIDAVGTGLVLPITVLYLINIMKFDAGAVATALTAMGIVSVLGAPLGGVLSDQFGGKPIVLASLITATVCFIGMVITSNYIAVMTLLAFVQFLDRCSKTAKIVFVAEFADPNDRTTLLAFQRSMRNGGYALGGVMSALSLMLGGDRAFAFLFISNALSFLYAATLIQGIHVNNGQDSSEAESKISFLQVMADRRYILTTLFNLVIVVHVPLLLVGVPFWVSEYTRAPVSFIPFLFTINTTIIMAFQPLFARMITNFQSTGRNYYLALPLYLLAFCCFYASSLTGSWTSLGLLITAVTVLSIGELLTSASEFYVSIEMAHPMRLGRYLSVFGLGIEFQRVAGPPLVVALLAGLAAYAWPVLAILVAVACAGLALLSKSETRQKHFSAHLDPSN